MKLIPKFRLPSFLVVAFITSILAGSALQAQTLVKLGDLGTGYSAASGINDSGQVVGIYSNLGDPRLFIYSNNTMTQLGVQAGEALDINNSGVVTGVAGFGDPMTGYSHAFTYANGVLQDLGALSGNQSFAYSINDSGTVVGSSTLSEGSNHAFLYSNGTMTDLGTLGGGINSVAYGINSSGQITGYSDLGKSGGYVNHAFLYSTATGTMTDLTPALGESYGTGINDSGVVVGRATFSNNGLLHAALFSNGTITDLGTLGGSYSIANSINNSGSVVGDSSTVPPSSSSLHAFLYTTGTGMVDLNTQYASLFVTGSGPQAGFTTLSVAYAINNLGQISGYGNYWDGTTTLTEAFLLYPATADAIFSTRSDSSSGLIIAKYNGSASHVIIPETIGGLTVTEIADSAFKKDITLTHLTIPNGVTTIGATAFGGCSNLVSAIFNGNAPTSTGAGIFKNAASNFTVFYYSASSTGFTSPTWTDTNGDSYPSVNLTVATPQTITPFATIPDCTFGVAPFAITPPTASSGLPVTVTVQSGPATIADNTVTVTGTGTVVLAADQAGDATYAPAPTVTTSFVVNPAVTPVTDPFNGTAIGDGWYSSAWFGTYNSTYYPWIYRTDLGFIYVETTDNTNLYLYVDNGNPAPMGWLYTTSSIYPNVYGFTKNSWLYFSGDTSFYNYTTQSWETY